MLSRERLSKAPRVQQVLLMGLASVARPTARVHLAEALIRTNLWPEAADWTKRPQGMNPHLQVMKDAGWVEEARQGIWICTPAARETAARQAFQEGLLRKLMAISQSPYATEGAFTRLLGEMRLALLEGRLEQMWPIHQRVQELHSRELNGRDPLCLVCGEPFDVAWFEGLGSELRKSAAWSLIKEQVLLFRPNPAFCKWIAGQAKAPKSSPLFMAICLFLLLEGRLGEVKNWLKVQEPRHREHPVFAGLEGILLFMQGKPVEADAHFQEALARLKKLTRKRILPLPAPMDFFHILSLLAQNTPPTMHLALERIEVLERNQALDPGAEQSVHLRRLHTALSGAQLPSTDNLKALGAPRRMGLLAAILCNHLAGAEVPAEDLKRFLQESETLCLGWFRGAAQELEFRSSGTVPTPHVLLDLVPRLEPWERALVALQDFGKASEVAAAPRPVRLAWSVQPITHRVTHYEIHPLEQRQGPKGAWSKGRPVSLRRLREETAQYDYLSEQDHRVIAAVQVTQDWQGLRYELDDAQALQALIGHPFVIWLEGTGSQAMELLAGRPELHLDVEGPRLTLTLTPRPSDYGATILPDGPNRRRVYTFAEEHRRLDAILGERLTVPLEAKARVLKTLGAIAPLVEIHSNLGLGANEPLVAGLETVKGDPLPRLLLLPHQQGLQARLRVRPLPEGPAYLPGHGGASLVLEHGGARLLVQRELTVERKNAENRLSALPSLDFNLDMEWILEDPEACLELLLEAEKIPDLTLEWPEGQRFKTPRSLGMEAMRLKVASGQDWFGIGGELRIDEDHVLDMKTLLDLLDQNPGRFVPLGEGRFLTLTKSFRRRLADLRSFGEFRGKELRLNPIAALAMNEFEEGWGGFQTDGGWKAHQERIRTAMALNPTVPSVFEAELRPYQEEGFQWMARLAEAGFGACLADDMGLGKTIQALALLLRRGTAGPSLVVAPTSVCANWEAEILKFAPTLRVRHLAEGDREHTLNSLEPLDVLLCSYGLLHTESDRLKAIDWSTVILDEAQAIKNSFTKRSQAAMELKAGFRLILSGTPLENHLGELWNLFRFINPGLLGSLESFQRRYQTPIERDKDPEALHRLRRLTAPFLLRRTKAQVLEELPSRTEITLELEPSAEETAFLEALRQKSLEAIEVGSNKDGQTMLVLAAITRLRRACCNPSLIQSDIGIASSKLTAFMDLADELRENHHRALVFSQFVDHLAILRRALDEQGFSYQYLDGSTSTKARTQAVTAFQRGEGELFLISLKAGGTGLNLTGADYVIHMDPWWNPAVEDQASDRAHRIGQTRPVTIYRLIIKGSIEQKIVGLHQSKRQLADQLLDERTAAARLDAKALLSLLRDA